jgi:ribosome-associated protein
MIPDLQISPGVTIPGAALKFEFTRSGGPGGQHVNKVATAVTLVFDLHELPGLTDEQRLRLNARLKSRIGSDGTLRITVREFRSQWRNRREAVERLREILMSGLVESKARRKTTPTSGSREKRLGVKKHLSEKKSLRRVRDSAEE